MQTSYRLNQKIKNISILFLLLIVTFFSSGFEPGKQSILVKRGKLHSRAKPVSFTFTVPVYGEEEEEIEEGEGTEEFVEPIEDKMPTERKTGISIVEKLENEVTYEIGKNNGQGHGSSESGKKVKKSSKVGKSKKQSKAEKTQIAELVYKIKIKAKPKKMHKKRDGKKTRGIVLNTTEATFYVEVKKMADSADEEKIAAAKKENDEKVSQELNKVTEELEKFKVIKKATLKKIAQAIRNPSSDSKIINKPIEFSFLGETKTMKVQFRVKPE